jgi:transposase
VLGKHIFNLAKQKGYTKGDVLFYDLSSGNIAGVRCVMAKWGHCKDGYRTHVVLLLVITKEGYPVYWELLEGNTPDVKTIEKLIEKIEKAFGKIESVLCFDRGMVSDDNLNLLENRSKPIKFITALDGDQIHYFKKFISFDLLMEVKNLKLKEQSTQIKKKLTDKGFNFVQDNLFYKELRFTQFQKEEIEKDTLKLGLEKRRYFLAFNPELAYLTHKHRKERVEEFREWIKDYNQELAKALSSRKESVVVKKIKEEMKRKKIANVEIKYQLTFYQVENKNEKGIVKRAITYKVTVGDIPEAAYKQSRKYDGIWMLITNMAEKEDKDFFSKTNFSSYFDIYRLKNNIEESFKILSQFVGVEPFYVYKTKHIQAHFTICVLSYLLDITIQNKIRGSSRLKNISLQRLFHILKKCKQDIIQINKNTTISKLTQVTNKQKAILDVLDCNHLVDPDYLLKRNIITIDNKRA